MKSKMSTKSGTRIIDSKKSKKIDYNDSKFKKGLQSVNESVNRTKSFKSVDDTKLHYTFSI